MTNLTAPRFNDEDKAREHLEALRWPDGPFCPHCGSFNAKRLPDQRGRPTKAHPEGAVRKGVVQCRDCRKQFSVTVATLFEGSKVPLHKWLLANHLLVSSKKGISAHQLHRMLGITYKTAWFMFHRIREAMRQQGGGQLGGDGGMVEVDETYIGRDRTKEQKAGGSSHKMKVLTMVDRASGEARSVVFDNFRKEEVGPIVRANTTLAGWRNRLESSLILVCQCRLTDHVRWWWTKAGEAIWSDGLSRSWRGCRIQRGAGCARIMSRV